MPNWLEANRVMLEALFLVSVASVLISLVVVPLVLLRLPADHFLRTHPADDGQSRTLLRTAAVIGRNIVGLLLVLAGTAMLVLPGQGLLAILAGVMLLDLPGKHRIEHWIISRPPVLGAINWYRRRNGRAPFAAVP